MISKIFLNKNMPKRRYFFEKIVKLPSSGDFASRLRWPSAFGRVLSPGPRTDAM